MVSVKCQLYMYEDLSSGPGSHIKAMLKYSYNPSAKWAGRGGGKIPWSSLAS